MGEAREIGERYYELFTAGQFEDATAMYADDCVTSTPTGDLDNAQHEGFARLFKGAFPDGHMEVTHVVEAGDDVCFIGRFKGTHTGDLVSPGGTIPASGNALDMPFVDYFRVSAGKIVAQESIFDQMTLLAQLGALGQ